MELRKIEYNGIVYELVCDSRNTRNGFAHDCTLFIDGREAGKGTCHYYNRTWECYRFQTVMKHTLSAVIANLKKDYLFAYKTMNGYKRMTAKRQREFENEFDTVYPVVNLREVYKQL